MKGMLRRPANKPGLEITADFLRMRESLEKLGGGNDTVQMFTRLAGALEVTYELVRTGRMPESKSMLGVVLNLLQDDNPNRAQEFDGSKMPAFQQVASTLARTGCSLKLKSKAGIWLAAF